MEIRFVQGPQGLDALGATAAPQPQPIPASFTPASSAKLEPAVKIDIGAEADQPRFIRDTETKSIVFQVVDSSGQVVDQLPSESALRNRAYASSTASAPDTRSGSAAISRVA